MMEMIHSDFVKSQKGVLFEINQAIEVGDIKKANLLTHTMRSYAALMNEHLLESISAAVEESLRKAEIPEKSQMDKLEVEIKKVFASLKEDY